MKLVVAVSGGIDSVVLLDALAKTDHELIVAHFDHGIRDDSAADARFVAELTHRYGRQFESAREELGSSASEAVARARRYKFLHSVAEKHDAQIVTAHHRDDVLETIALNSERGTGWRGLAVFGDYRIYRPLTRISKQQLYDYALTHHLEWVEDSTNRSDVYARNRIRKRLAGANPETAKKILALWLRQTELRGQIAAELKQVADNQSRYFLTMIDEASAQEIVNHQLKTQLGEGVTRPNLARLLLAIKTAQPGTRHDIGNGAILEVKKDRYIVRRPG